MITKPTVTSLGIILDGNRRFAKQKNLSSLEGHRAGLENLRTLSKELPRLRIEYGLEYVTLYAFSTENWNRAADEVRYLMELFSSAFDELIRTVGNDARIRVIGQRERFSLGLQERFNRVEESTASNTGTTVVFALSYGGRAEILHAISEVRKTSDEVTEELFSKALWSHGIPHPDIIVRTGGEQRLSNFLTWQSVYSELFFTETLWPDFTVGELENIFQEFALRERRHGK